MLNVSRYNGSDCCDVKEYLKENPNSFLKTNMVSEAINVGIKENIKAGSPIEEVTVVKVNETFIIVICTARKNKLKAYAQAVTDDVEKTTDEHCVKSVRVWNCSGPYFPAFGRNTERYSVSLRIQFECKKIRTRKTANMDNFHAVENVSYLKKELQSGSGEEFINFAKIKKNYFKMKN